MGPTREAVGERGDRKVSIALSAALDKQTKRTE
jgi:hypothetical protein